MAENNTSKKSSNLTTILIFLVILLLVFVFGEFFYFNKNSVLRRNEERMESNVRQSVVKGSSTQRFTRTGSMAMLEVTPPVLSSQQEEQLKIGKDVSITKKTFNITGGNFYFVPNKITVNKGDKVTLIMTNAGGKHNLMLDEFNIETSPVSTANTITVTFTTDKIGSFVYYCSVPGHRQKGMWGTLVVQ